MTPQDFIQKWGPGGPWHPDRGQARLIRLNFVANSLYGRTGAKPERSITYFPWPTLDELRPYLGIPIINTGRQYTHVGASGCVMDDLEGLHAIADERGHLMFPSGMEMPLATYRGQTEEHIPCLPSLARLEHIEDQLISLCCNVAFEEAIAAHPYVRLCEQARFLDAPLAIDKQGLVQHYGLPTDLLDVTSNFDVASFFATSEWNATTFTYQPVKFAKQPGVLYRLPPYLQEPSPHGPFLSRPIGWQPLSRPEQQRAFAVVLKRGQDLTQLPRVQAVRFRHNGRVSVRIWKAFDEGRALFPPDAAAELALQAKSLMRFTGLQIDKAWAKLDDWNGAATKAVERLRVEKSAGFSVVEQPPLTWDSRDVERDETKLRDQLTSVLDRVRYRMSRFL